MKLRYAIPFTLLTISACDNMQEGASNAANTVGNETAASWNSMRDLIGIGKPKPEPKTSPQQRYCYRAQQDIICYSKPLDSDQDERLEAYQDSKGHTGYVLPRDEANGQPPKPLPKLETVNVPPPPSVLAASSSSGTTQKKKLKEIIFDPAELEPKELVPDKPQ